MRFELKADPPQCPSRTRLAALNARRDAIKDDVKKAKTRLPQTSDAWIKADLKSLLLVLERRLTRVEAEIAQQLKADDRLARLVQPVAALRPVSGRSDLPC